MILRDAESHFPPGAERPPCEVCLNHDAYVAWVFAPQHGQPASITHLCPDCHFAMSLAVCFEQEFLPQTLAASMRAIAKRAGLDRALAAIYRG